MARHQDHMFGGPFGGAGASGAWGGMSPYEIYQYGYMNSAVPTYYYNDTFRGTKDKNAPIGVYTEQEHAKFTKEQKKCFEKVTVATLDGNQLTFYKCRVPVNPLGPTNFMASCSGDKYTNKKYRVPRFQLCEIPADEQHHHWLRIIECGSEGLATIVHDVERRGKVYILSFEPRYMQYLQCYQHDKGARKKSILAEYNRDPADWNKSAIHPMNPATFFDDEQMRYFGGKKQAAANKKGFTDLDEEDDNKLLLLVVVLLLVKLM